MKQKKEIVLNELTSFLKWSSKMAGKPLSFVVALSLVIIWCVYGFFWGFDANWLLIINTVATINASLMVFIIQNTQNRESKALHLKIDELIYAIKEAEDELIAIEEIEEQELEKLKEQLTKRRKEKNLPRHPKKEV